jgi:hypothetical protein
MLYFLLGGGLVALGIKEFPAVRRELEVRQM